MNQPHQKYLDDLDSAILESLNSEHNSNGISEFDLIKQLQQPPYSLFNEQGFHQPLILFQTHFIVYNALYRLKQHGIESQSFDLDILATQIILLPFATTDMPSRSTQINPTDPLSEYYLDWKNFSETKEQDVTKLLDNFWRIMAGDDFTESEQNALAVFSFDSLPTLEELKTSYKTLSHQHHPDKGGDHKTYSEITTAYNLLKKRVS